MGLDRQAGGHDDRQDEDRTEEVRRDPERPRDPARAPRSRGPRTCASVRGRCRRGAGRSRPGRTTASAVPSSAIDRATSRRRRSAGSASATSVDDGGQERVSARRAQEHRQWPASARWRCTRLLTIPAPMASASPTTSSHGHLDATGGGAGPRWPPGTRYPAAAGCRRGSGRPRPGRAGRVASRRGGQVRRPVAQAVRRESHQPAAMPMASDRQGEADKRWRGQVVGGHRRRVPYQAREASAARRTSCSSAVASAAARMDRAGRSGPRRGSSPGRWPRPGASTSPGSHQQPRDAIDDRLDHAPDRGRHDDRPGCHRLEGDQAERLRVRWTARPRRPPAPSPARPSRGPRSRETPARRRDRPPGRPSGPRSGPSPRMVSGRRHLPRGWPSPGSGHRRPSGGRVARRTGRRFARWPESDRESLEFDPGREDPDAIRDWRGTQRAISPARNRLLATMRAADPSVERASRACWLDRAGRSRTSAPCANRTSGAPSSHAAGRAIRPVG